MAEAGLNGFYKFSFQVYFGRITGSCSTSVCRMTEVRINQLYITADAKKIFLEYNAIAVIEASLHKIFISNVEIFIIRKGL